MSGVVYIMKIYKIFNPFEPNVPFLYLPETPENHWFSDVFRGY